MITGTTWLSTDLSTTVQAPAFCPMSYHTTPCLSLIIPLALRRTGFFLNDFLNDHPSFLVLRTAFLRGMPGAGKKSAHLPELCPLQREASLAPKGATSLPVRCRWHYEGPSYLPTSLPQPLFCLQLQDRCQHATLQAWQRRNEAQFPRGVLGYWCCLRREDFGPEIMPCQVLLHKTQWLVSSVSHNSTPRADAHGHLDKRSSLFCLLLPQSSAQCGSRSEEGAHHPNLTQ